VGQGTKSLRSSPLRGGDRPPFLGIGLHQRAERFRRVLLAWKNLSSELDNWRSNRRIGQRRQGHRIELLNDIAFPPGRLRLETNPSPIGSAPD
jgi:hypothetical protein